MKYALTFARPRAVRKYFADFPTLFDIVDAEAHGLEVFGSPARSFLTALSYVTPCKFEPTSSDAEALPMTWADFCELARVRFLRAFVRSNTTRDNSVEGAAILAGHVECFERFFDLGRLARFVEVKADYREKPTSEEMSLARAMGIHTENKMQLYEAETFNTIAANLIDYPVMRRKFHPPEWCLPFVSDGADYIPGLVPEEDFIMEGVAIRRDLTVVVSEGGDGKSTWLNEAGMCIASGKDFFHLKVPEQGNVLMVNREDGHSRQIRRADAAYEHLGVNQQSLAGTFHRWLVGDGRPLVNPDSYSMHTEFRNQLAYECKRLEVDMLVLDPLAKLFQGLSENNNEHGEMIARTIIGLAHECNLAAVVAHHASKGARMSEQSASRGFSSFVSSARVNINLDKEAGGRVQMYNPKHTTQKEATELGTWTFVGNDTAGVLIPWVKPPNGVVVPKNDREKVLDLVEAGNADGNPWGTYHRKAMAEVLGMDPDKLKAVLAVLERESFLERFTFSFTHERSRRSYEAWQVVGAEPVLHISAPDVE